MTEIPVIYSFARSGGTLVNQLLGVHPQCMVLSEINPAASFKSITEQALEWLGLLNEKEADEFESTPYHQKILFLHKLAARENKKLIIRDWVSINFLPGTAGDIKPSRELEQIYYLKRAGLKPLPLVIARKGEAVYKSIRENFPNMASLSLKSFSEAYLRYACAVADFPKIHLENLRSQPEAILEEILNRFKLASDKNSMLLENFFNFKNCTGNVSLKKGNKSASAKTILPPENHIQSKSNPELTEANKILGYDR